MDNGDSLALYAKMKAEEERDRDELDSGSEGERERRRTEDSANEAFVEKLNKNEDEELLADSDDSGEVDVMGLLELSDSEDEIEDNTGERDEKAIAAKQRAKRREALDKRHTFDKFFMPKLSALRRAAGLLPPEEVKEEAKKRRVFGAKADEENPVPKATLYSELVDSAKELLAYWTGEEMYETKPLGFEDIPDIIGAAARNNWRRFQINWIGFYRLNLRGFSRYYKPASKALLVACRSRYVKPYQVADLLEEGADPNIAEVGTESTPLHYIVRRGNLKVTRLLVEAGANVMAFDAQHRNPLMCAADTNRTADQVRIVRYFLSLKVFAENPEYLECRDTGGNTAAINAIFKGNVWILRELLNAGARVTEDWKEMGYESAHHVAMWVYAAGLLSDIDQLTPKARQDFEAMNCCFHYFSLKGHYYWAPLLLVQSFWKYQNELCLRMCQNAKRREDLIDYPARPRKPVLVMNDKRAADRKQRRADKEAERERRDRRAKKLVSRKLAHEVKEVEEWNNQRLMFARRIDGEFKKGLRGQGDKLTHEWVMKQFEKDGPKVWEKQIKTGSFYMSNAPPIADTKVKTIELEAVLQERHNRTNNPDQKIYVYGGSPAENAYAKASWVERDEEAKKAELQNLDNNDGEGPESNSEVKANGWKLATRTEFGFINRDSVWAKNKVASPFIVPPTEQDVYLSDNSDDDMMIELSPAPSPVKGNSTTRNASPAKSIGGS